MNSGHESTLEVAPGEENPKYFVASSRSYDHGKETYNHGAPIPSSHEKESNGHQGIAQPDSGKLCGLPKKIFWIALGIAGVIVVAAAVGGGVGGSLSNKKKADEQAPVSQTNTSSMPSTGLANTQSVPTTTTSQEYLTTTTTQSPKYTLLVDCPSSNWTLYTPSGTSQIFRKICDNSPLNIGSINALVNEPVTTFNDCIDLCAAYNVKNAAKILAGSASVCNGLCWRDTIQGNDWPGQCFGYETRNISGAWTLNDNSHMCAGAGLINQ